VKKNEILPKNLRSLDWMYDLKYHNGRMIRSITMDVWPRAQTYGLECDNELYFRMPSYSSYFLILELF
jgi:hypothetical protein